MIRERDSGPISLRDPDPEANIRKPKLQKDKMGLEPESPNPQARRLRRLLLPAAVIVQRVLYGYKHRAFMELSWVVLGLGHHVGRGWNPPLRKAGCSV